MDGIYLRRNWGGEYENAAVPVALAVNEDGYREVPGAAEGMKEDKASWVSFLLIDEEAAAVVRRIFCLSIEGYGPSRIAGILRDDKIDCPSVYMGKRGQGTQRNSFDACCPYDWNGTSISYILAKPEYMGHTVNFRMYKESYKDKHSIKRPPEEWMIIENIHEAIVDPKTLSGCVRACLKSSNEDGNEGKRENLSRNIKFAFTIFPKSAEFVEPAEKTLYHPAAWQNDKLV
jgi:hypothetical protein